MKTQPQVKEGSCSRLSARGAITARSDNSRVIRSSRGSRAPQAQLSTRGANSAHRRNSPVPQSSTSSSSSDSDPAPKAPVAGRVSRTLQLDSSIVRVGTRQPPRKQRHIDSMNYLKTLTRKVSSQKPDMCRIRNLRAMCIDVCLIYLKGTRFYDALKFMYASGMYATKLSIMKVNPAKYHLQFYLPKVSIHPFAVSVIGTRSMYERPYFSTDPDPGESSIDNKAPKRRKFHYCSKSD